MSTDGLEVVILDYRMARHERTRASPALRGREFRARIVLVSGHFSPELILATRRAWESAGYSRNRVDTPASCARRESFGIAPRALGRKLIRTYTCNQFSEVG